MENLNLPPFYVGQKVVHVGTPYGFLGKYTLHTITSLFKTACGCYYVLVDNEPIVPITTRYANCKCGCRNITVPGYFVGYISTDFRPIQESKFRAVSFEKNHGRNGKDLRELKNCFIFVVLRPENHNDILL